MTYVSCRCGIIPQAQFVAEDHVPIRLVCLGVEDPHRDLKNQIADTISRYIGVPYHADADRFRAHQNFVIQARRIESILRDIKYKDWEFRLNEDAGCMTLQVEFAAPDLDDMHERRIIRHRGRKWRLSYHMTKSEIVQTALMAVLAAEEHEAREQFKYRGRAVFGPHFDVDDLVKLYVDGQIREDKRTNKETRECPK